MARDPLKHKVRSELWESYVSRITGGRPLRSYLTLYSPPMMDVKHLYRKGLVDRTSETYSGVTGVTLDEDAYAAAIDQSSHRPELLVLGDINQLLLRKPLSAQAKQLRNAFPFQVINLDYTNHLFANVNRNPISAHLAALDEIIIRQHKQRIRQFCLFLTTRADVEYTQRFAEPFLRDLTRRLNQNIDSHPNFSTGFNRSFGCQSGEALKARNYQDFVSIGLVKLVSQILQSHNYNLHRSDSALIIRDDSAQERRMLHLAFAVRESRPGRARARNLHELGRPQSQTGVLGFLRNRDTQLVLRTSSDLASLRQEFDGYLSALAAETFELEVPKPIQQNAES